MPTPTGGSGWRLPPRTVAPLLQPGASEDLPYAVELWTLARGQVERVLGRANSASLAQAIFAAAQTEHLGRKITLRHGGDVIAARE